MSGNRRSKIEDQNCDKRKIPLFNILLIVALENVAVNFVLDCT